jgi:hypothetical protein
MTIDRRALADQGYVKLEMRDSDGFVETAWAQRTDPDRDEFRLDNNPFYAYRVSAGDIVEGEPIAPGMYRFVRVVRPPATGPSEWRLKRSRQTPRRRSRSWRADVARV